LKKNGGTPTGVSELGYGGRGRAPTGRNSTANHTLVSAPQNPFSEDDPARTFN